MEVSVIQSSVHMLSPEIHRPTEKQRQKKWWRMIMAHILPNGQQINRYITQMFCVLFLYAIFYGMLGDEALPGGTIFALFVTVIAAFWGGKLFGLLQLPPLVGMLIVGFLFRNIKAIPFYHHIPKKVVSDLRVIALSIILLRAGIGLDGEALKKLKLTVLRLTVCPQLIEVLCMGIFGHFILGLPFVFSFMLGFIVANISPEVVLPPLLEFEKLGYGVRKGIPALIIGATALDDIVAVSGFIICFSIAFSTKKLVWTIMKAQLEPLIGLALSAIFGSLFWHLPNAHDAKIIVIYYNVLLVVLGSEGVMFFSQRVDFAGSGPLFCIFVAFTACIKWRKDPRQFKGVCKVTDLLWDIVEPMLFSLVGAEITIDTLQWNAGWAVLTLVVCIFFRFTMTYLILFGCNLNYKEKLFICCAYLPKASLQAAIGSQALDYSRKHNKPDEIAGYSLIVLNVCVLSLLLTAPLASILIRFLGPVLLTKDVSSLHLVALQSTESFSEEEYEKEEDMIEDRR